MSETQIQKHFPGSTIGLIHQSGDEIGARERGVTVLVHLRNGVPTCAEVFGEEHHAEIGLWWEGKTLVDYDGVFEMPRELAEVLTEHGFTLPQD